MRNSEKKNLKKNPNPNYWKWNHFLGFFEKILILFSIFSSLWYKWAALVSACLLVFSVQLGIQTLPNLLSGELFPSDIRAFGKGLTRAATCGFLVIALKLFPILQNQLNLHGTFFLFSGILLIALPIVYCILPETKDMGLEMIQNYFTPNKTVFYVDLPKEQTDLI